MERSTVTLDSGAVREALDQLINDCERMAISARNIKLLLYPDRQPILEPDIDPKDPRNKYDGGKLTGRGIEVCYRLFDRGVNRNQVASLMDISFNAATHRYTAWQKQGGVDRVRGKLD